MSVIPKDGHGMDLIVVLIVRWPFNSSNALNEMREAHRAVGMQIRRMQSLTELTLLLDANRSHPDMLRPLLSATEILRECRDSPLKERVRVTLVFVGHSLPNIPIGFSDLVAEAALELQAILLQLPLLQPLVLCCNARSRQGTRRVFWEEEMRALFQEFDQRGLIRVRYWAAEKSVVEVSLPSTLPQLIPLVTRKGPIENGVYCSLSC